ncbi:uncharacterized protein [Glycine max]|uniref:uncharacterized protein n=1 Tax=Glycine max TaxID=3847 RepID=UPI001B355D60|nr:uncharacterized protein LOC121172833 [Glycine max]
MEDTNELLHLLVDAMNRGLRDANGSLSKQNVERIILPQLNAKTKFPKTYSHYLSRMKWFRNQYNMMSTLMRNNSGFGWDPIGKTFTAHEDVWKDYLKSHPSHSKLRGKSMVDYEYLKIVVGGGVSSGNNSISVDPDDTDATTFEPENRTVGIEEFSYDPNSDTFITPNNYEPAYQPPSPNQPSPPSHPPLDSEVPIEKQNCHKRRRSEYGGSSSAVGINNQGNVLENLSVGIGTIAYNMMSTLMRNNSGFGWDPIGKTFTAHEDVWKDYLKSHPSHSKLRGKSMVDYEYLKIVLGVEFLAGIILYQSIQMILMQQLLSQKIELLG